MNTLLTALCACGIALQYLDYWTTREIIERGGFEKNKIIAAAMQRLGTLPALILFKLIGVAMFAALYAVGADHSFNVPFGVGQERWPELSTAVAAILVVGYALLIRHNWRVYRRINPR